VIRDVACYRRLVPRSPRGINAAIWIPPQRGAKLPSFGSQASWLFAGVRPAVVTLAIVAAGGFVISGAAYLAQSPWWAPIGILAATASLALIIATFTPWWSGAIIINAVIICAAWDTTVAQLSGR
jgi:hypothetical protein